MKEIKAKYKHFCNTNHVPIFYHPWWLDIVCGPEKWNAALVENENSVLAVHPYYLKRRKFVSMPNFTPYMGPLLNYPEEQNYRNRLKFEKDNMSKMIEQLPRFIYFNQRFPAFINNWLPFYWKDFKQTTRYTYVISLDKDEDTLFSQFKENVRRNIKKARKTIKVVDGLHEIHVFYKLLAKNLKLTYTEELLNKLINTCYKNNAGKLFLAKDENDQIYCGVFIVWDKEKTYYLLGAREPRLNNTRAMSLLLWEAIKTGAEKSKYFDFEGSMIETVERFFRNFGTEQQQYFHVHKYNSVIIRGIIGLLGIFNKKYF
jgi:hypothetical protein